MTVELTPEQVAHELKLAAKAADRLTSIVQTVSRRRAVVRARCSLCGWETNPRTEGQLRAVADDTFEHLGDQHPERFFGLMNRIDDQGAELTGPVEAAVS